MRGWEKSGHRGYIKPTTKGRKNNSQLKHDRAWATFVISGKHNRSHHQLKLGTTMDGDNLKSYLELKIIWKDDDMFELRVTATNGRFFGTTDVYDTSDSLIAFATSLLGYPKEDKTLIHEAGQKDSYAYFAMKFYCIDNAGHVGVEVCMEENVSTQYRQEEKDKVKLEIIVEPNAIDNFQKQLFSLAKNEEGTAILYGSDNRLDN